MRWYLLVRVKVNKMKVLINSLVVLECVALGCSQY